MTDPQPPPDLSVLRDAMPFAVTVGIDVTAASAEAVVGRLDWTPERCTAAGVLHGGAIVTLADSVGALCAFLNLPPGHVTNTIESKTNFFRAVRDGYIEATARAVHVGRSTIVVETDVRDAKDRRVALVIQTQAVLPAETAERRPVA